MITEEQRAEIRRLFVAEHWKVGTIVEQLGVHRDTVVRAIEVDRFVSRGRQVPSALDPYIDFIAATLEAYPRLRATRLHEMLVARGYRGSVVQTRRTVRRLRPKRKAEAYLRLVTLPGEQGLGGGAADERLALRAKLRSERSREIVARIKAWALATAPTALHRSSLGRAIRYMLELWEPLTRFLDEPRVPLDNMAAERALRGVVVGRKNHYGSKSRRGAEVAAVLQQHHRELQARGAESQGLPAGGSRDGTHDREAPRAASRAGRRGGLRPSAAGAPAPFQRTCRDGPGRGVTPDSSQSRALELEALMRNRLPGRSASRSS